MDIQNLNIVLASASPRRSELLSQVGLTYRVIPSNMEELIADTDPKLVVLGLSKDKALEVANRQNDNVLVIGADTVVCYKDRILGKPETEEEAYSMIQILNNDCHSVYTGVTIVDTKPSKNRVKSFVEETKVYVKDMSDQDIWNYISTGESMDKAGAYGIQGRFAEYITGIQGDYNNVVGLPISRLLYEIKCF